MITHRVTKAGLTIFCISLLFLACTIRSKILVDSSFLPRFAILLLILSVAWIAGVNRLIQIRNNLFETAFILFYAWSLLSMFWSIESSEAILHSQLIFLSLGIFLMVSALVGKYSEFEHLFIKTHLLVLMFSYGLAFYKMSLLDYYDPYKIISISSNNNLYSGFLLISLPLVFSGYILLKGTWKYLSVLAGILSFFFIIIVQSRAAYLGTTAAVIISLILLKVSSPQVFSKRNILTAFLSGLVLVFCLFIFTNSLDNTRRQYFLRKISVWQYFRSYDQLQGQNIRKLHEPAVNMETSTYDFSKAYYSNANWRVIFWKKSAGLIKAHPIIGAGSGNWRLAIPAVINPLNPEHTIGNFTYSEPHNEWVRILSELGIIGFILAILVFFLPPASVYYRLLFSQQKVPPETIIYAAFITGFYLYAVFDFPLRRVEHNIVLWSIIAFLLNKVPLEPIRHVMFPKLSLKWGTLIFISLALLTALLALARLKGEYYTLQIFRNERKNDSLVIQYCRKAEGILYRVTPNTLPVSWFEGVAHARLGDNDAARICFLRALTVTPYEVRVLNDYGATLFRLGKPNEASESLKKALIIDPFFDDARFNLAAIYFMSGQRKNAWEQIMHCRESQKKRDVLGEMMLTGLQTESN